VIGSRSTWRWVPPKLLQCLQSFIPWIMDASRHRPQIISVSALFITSYCQCPPFRCCTLASSTASSFIMHSTFTIAHALLPYPTCHSLLSSNMYSNAQCFALLLSLMLHPWSNSNNDSITSNKIGSIAKQQYNSAVWPMVAT